MLGVVNKLFCNGCKFLQSKARSSHGTEMLSSALTIVKSNALVFVKEGLETGSKY